MGTHFQVDDMFGALPSQVSNATRTPASSRLVVALGGNALLRRGQELTLENQRISAAKCAPQIAKLAQSDFQVVLTHGNGPQVGQLALERTAPFDLLGAESQGQIGYVLSLALQASGLQTATVMTQVLVDEGDPAFEDPTKFIGPVYSHQEAQSLAKELGWTVKADGDECRRVVPSPRPLEIVQLSAIEALLDADYPMVIACGGGGIPVRKGERGVLEGVEAVIDKDMCSSLLARELSADGLILLTDGGGIWKDFNKPEAMEMKRASPQYLTDLSAKEPWQFPAGSMGPKIDACIDFITKSASPQAWAAIGDLNDAGAIISGEAGTIITNDVDGVEWRDDRYLQSLRDAFAGKNKGRFVFPPGAAEYSAYEKIVEELRVEMAKKEDVLRKQIQKMARDDAKRKHEFAQMLQEGKATKEELENAKITIQRLERKLDAKY